MENHARCVGVLGENKNEVYEYMENQMSVDKIKVKRWKTAKKKLVIFVRLLFKIVLQNNLTGVMETCNSTMR